MNQIFSIAKELKYNQGVKKVLLKEFETPSKEFTKAIAKQVYTGVLTPQLKEKFSQIIINKINEIINEKNQYNKTIQLDKRKHEPKKEPSTTKPTTDTEKLFLEYWNKFHDYLEENNRYFNRYTSIPR